MAKRGQRSHNLGRQTRQYKHRRQTRPAPTRRRAPDDLLADVRQRLGTGEPLDFLAYASTLLAAVDLRGQNPFERERAGRPERATLTGLLESSAEVVLPETTALLAALADLGPDELTRARARRALGTRPPPPAGWLGGGGGAAASSGGLAGGARRSLGLPRDGEHACARRRGQCAARRAPAGP